MRALTMTAEALDRAASPAPRRAHRVVVSQRVMRQGGDQVGGGQPARSDQLDRGIGSLEAVRRPRSPWSHSSAGWPGHLPASVDLEALPWKDLSNRVLARRQEGARSPDEPDRPVQENQPVTSRKTS